MPVARTNEPPTWGATDIGTVGNGQSEEVALANMERQFSALRCEAQHNGRICSGDVTHGFATCEGSRVLCLLGAAVKEAYLL